jgi:hypothetical protein
MLDSLKVMNFDTYSIFEMDLRGGTNPIDKPEGPKPPPRPPMGPSRPPILAAIRESAVPQTPREMLTKRRRTEPGDCAENRTR